MLPHFPVRRVDALSETFLVAQNRIPNAFPKLDAQFCHSVYVLRERCGGRNVLVNGFGNQILESDALQNPRSDPTGMPGSGFDAPSPRNPARGQAPTDGDPDSTGSAKQPPDDPPLDPEQPQAQLESPPGSRL